MILEREMLSQVLDLARGGNTSAVEALREYERNNQRLRTRAGSVNVDARTAEVIAATEAPVDMPDWTRYEMVPEVLRADGFSLPEGATSVPLLDTHNRGSVSDILGTAESWKNAGGIVSSTIRFARTDAGNTALALAADGHLTDVSVGYEPIARSYVEKGTTLNIKGRTYTGPMNVVTAWTVKELSACPIGADSSAKIRAAIDPTNTGIKPKASAAGNPQQEGSSMEPSNTPGTTPAVEGQRANAPTQPTATVIDTEAIRAAEERGRLAEINRQNEIRQLGELSNMTADVVSPFLTDPKRTVDEARAAFLKIVTERTKAPTVDVVVVNNQGDDSARAAETDAFLVRAGILPFDRELKRAVGDPIKCHPRTREFMVGGFHQSARQILAKHGRKDAWTMPSSQLRDAIRSSPLSASDLSTLQANVLNKSLLTGWGLQNTVWRDIASTMSLKDLRAHRLYKDGGYGLMHEIGETAEVPQENRGDGKYETITGTTFSKLVSISDEAFINDDLGALAREAQQIGMMLDQTCDHLVLYTLTQGSSNVGPTMTEDSIACFDASTHVNYITSGAAPSVTTLNVGLAAMRKKTRPTAVPDGAKVPLNLQPAIILVPTALEGTTMALLNSISNPGDNNVNSVNIWYKRLKPVVSPVLDIGASVYKKTGLVTSTAVTAGWYLLTDPTVYQHLVLGFLNGNETPEFVSERPIEILATQYRLTARMGAGIADWRGLFYNDGA